MTNTTKSKLLASLFLLGSVSVWAETGAPSSEQGRSDLKAKWQQMSLEQKKTFLKDHPKFAEWLAIHDLEANPDQSLPDSSANTSADPSSDSPGASSSNAQGSSSSTAPGASGNGGTTPTTGSSAIGTTPSTTTSNSPTTTTSTTPGTGASSTTPQGKWGQMTPEQKEAFLKNHPAIAEKFAQAHPDAEQRLAQTNEAGPGVSDPGHPRVNEVNGRETFQQKRIAQDESKGKLTPQEQAQLQRSGNRIQKQEGNDLAKNDGHLTPLEKAHLNHEENRRSHHINEDSHEQNHEQNHE